MTHCSTSLAEAFSTKFWLKKLSLFETPKTRLWSSQFVVVFSLLIRQFKTKKEEAHIVVAQIFSKSCDQNYFCFVCFNYLSSTSCEHKEWCTINIPPNFFNTLLLRIICMSWCRVRFTYLYYNRIPQYLPTWNRKHVFIQKRL